MSTAILHRAASLMRERAEAAIDGPWNADPRWYSAKVRAGYGSLADGDHVADAADPLTSIHIATWHPAVALAVADWLDDIDTEGHNPDESCCGACEVARAYLGESA